MKYLKSKGQLKACFSPKEVATLLISRFFTKLFSAQELKNEPYDSTIVSKYIKGLANQTVDSTDYELYIAILDLYEQFEKNCQFCFNLKSTFDIQVNKITNIDDLYRYREDPPDVIVLYKNKPFEFELKRYRGNLTFESIYDFVMKKIITHYSGKSNYLILLQPTPYSKISFDVFKQLNDKIRKEKKQAGKIGFSLNNDNKEMILVRILPKLEIYKRKYNKEVEVFAEILHSE